MFIKFNAIKKKASFNMSKKKAHNYMRTLRKQLAFKRTNNKVSVYFDR